MSEQTPATNGTFEEYPLTRRDAAGLIVLTCTAMPGLLLTATSESEVRAVINEGLQMSLQDRAAEVHVYTNSSIKGPIIDTAVKLVG